MDLLKRITVYLFVLLAGVLLLKVLFLHAYPDFTIYYQAAKIWLSGGNPYNDISLIRAPFIYPPLSLFFFLPLLLFPLGIASMIWVIFSLLLLVASVLLLAKLQKISIGSYDLLVITGLIFLMFPVKFTLGMGEINIVILFLSVLCMYFITLKKGGSAALSWTIAMAIKLTPLLFFAYFLLNKDRRTLWRSVVLGFLALILSFVLLWNLSGYYLQHVLPDLVSGWPLAYYNQSLAAFVGRLCGRTDFSLLLYRGLDLLFVLITAVVLWMKRGRAGVEMLSLSALLILSLILAPLAWQHHFVLVIPALFILFCRYRNSRTKARWILLGLSYLLVATNSSHSQSLPLLVQSHVLYGAVLLWGLCLYEIFSSDQK